MTYPERRRAVVDLLVRTAGAQQEADDLIAQSQASADPAGPGPGSSGLVRRCYPANALAVGWARAAITRLVQDALPTVRVESVCVAVGEAMSNAVTHAYSGTPGSVHVTAGFAGGAR